MPYDVRAIAAIAALVCLILAPVLTLLGGQTRAAAAAACPGEQVIEGERGTWTIHSGPVFGEGGSEISDFTIDTASPAKGYATNGAVVMRTLDDGCSWQEVYRLPQRLPETTPVELSRIDRLTARGGVVIAVIDALQGSGAATLVTRSPDGGDSWDAVSLLPGAPGDVTFGNAGNVWVGAGPVVHRSENFGSTFTATSPLPEERRVEHLAAGHLTANVVWAKVAGGAAYRTVDGGQSWEPFADHTAAAGPALGDIGNPGLMRVTFLKTDPQSRALTGIAYSQNNGGSWQHFGAESVAGTVGAFESLAALSRHDEVAVTTRDPAGKGNDGVYVWNSLLRKLVSIDEFGLAPLRLSQAETRPEEFPHFHFFDASSVYVWEPPVGGTKEILPPVPSLERLPPLPPDSQARLEPAGGEVRVRAGQSRTIAYELRLPSRSAQIDTFFLLDTSTSTEGYIDGLRVGLPQIALGFAVAGIDAKYGLGEYQDQSNPLHPRYDRLAAIGPADLLRQALARIKTAGGEEPGYTAVAEALTGRGIPHPRSGAPVAPRRPGWRPRAVRTMVLIADESFARDPYGADRDRAVAAIKKSGVRFIGVVVRDPKAKPLTGRSVPECGEVIAKPTLSIGGALGAPRLRCQLEDLARAAGTLAPAGGTDCDGDGSVDVAAGQPLVCTLSGGASAGIVAVGEPLRRVLLAVTDEQPVALASSDPAHLVVNPGGDYSKIDIKRVQGLTFEVIFACGENDGGREFAARLEGLVAGRGIASATPRLVCEAVPAAAAAKPRKPKPPAREPQRAPGPAPAPPAPVPAPPVPAAPQVSAPIVPLPVPAPVPPPAPANAPAPASAPASAPAVAAAEKEEVAPAIRLIGDDEPEPHAELAFSRVLGAAGVLFGAVALWPLPRRTPPPLARVSIQPTTTRRRRRRRP